MPLLQVAFFDVLSYNRNALRLFTLHPKGICFQCRGLCLKRSHGIPSASKGVNSRKAAYRGCFLFWQPLNRKVAMTNTRLQSPWRNLPTASPYILPDDLEYIQHHPNFSHLRLETLPGQFAGGLNTAEVIFLALNPGFDESDITVSLQLPTFLEANRINHNDPYGSPFYYFGGGLEQTGGYKWWVKILGELLRSEVTEATLRDKIMLIEYLPYHSVSDPKIKTRMPSQQFAFNLVREAIELKKTIVIMRSEELWREAVPELTTYNYMLVKNLRRPFISPGNLGEENFNIILSKLTSKEPSN